MKKLPLLLIPMIFLISCTAETSGSLKISDTVSPVTTDAATTEEATSFPQTEHTEKETSSVSETPVSSEISEESEIPVSELITSEVFSEEEISSEPAAAEKDLFISEFYNIGYDKDLNPSGKNNDKALELYNPLDETLDLSSYCIEIYSNGLTEVKSESYAFALSGTLESGKTYVIADQYAQDGLKAKADDIHAPFLGISGKCSIRLFHEDKLIDEFGCYGKSYEDSSCLSIGEETNAGELHNILRKPGYANNITFTENEWTVSFDNDFSTLGSHVFILDETLENYDDVLFEMAYYWSEQTVTGNVPIITSYKGYTFQYDFYDYYFSKDGTMKIEPDDNFELYFALSICDADSNVLETTYDVYFTYKKAA